MFLIGHYIRAKYETPCVFKKLYMSKHVRMYSPFLTRNTDRLKFMTNITYIHCMYCTTFHTAHPACERQTPTEHTCINHRTNCNIQYIWIFSGHTSRGYDRARHAEKKKARPWNEVGASQKPFSL